MILEMVKKIVQNKNELQNQFDLYHIFELRPFTEMTSLTPLKMYSVLGCRLFFSQSLRSFTNL